ncbi:kynureninase [Tersicoccus solisilvae]|uniref:Kynureninase n=1 Tax=Tersicoccus solisilvae TaxID=1882339 RepID=A0ABQ1P500_9MICC|nr:aminotransferase class V-fold PLP-dependent enzyme [Tersicoccus solisilvae]GGC90670.1 kynureninase [Tersicoccus solisilvae]
MTSRTPEPAIERAPSGTHPAGADLTTADGVRDAAAALDAADALAGCRDLFVPADAPAAGVPVTAYLDGNSLGRPLRATEARLHDLVRGAWGTGLIRSWDDQWMALPYRLGDRLGAVCLGAAAGQTVIGDSTTVMLYKLLHAALTRQRTASDGRRVELVLDRENFPTDRYVAATLADALGAELVWIDPDPAAGVTVEQVRAAVGDRTAVVLLSHVAYKSAWLADLPAITAAVHDAGALVLWDLCHSAGVVEEDLDEHDVDLAVGCSYKFLNGGPGAPAFGYVAARLQRELTSPITGWMGHAEPFTMGPDYAAGHGMRRFVSGTPAVLGMAGIEDAVDLIDDVGLAAVRAKARSLGEFVVAAVDGLLSRHGVRVVSPRDPALRGAHVTIGHPRSRDLYRQLWGEGIVPDFREPDGIRLGLAPLSTSYAEVAVALTRIDELLG